MVQRAIKIPWAALRKQKIIDFALTRRLTWSIFPLRKYFTQFRPADRRNRDRLKNQNPNTYNTWKIRALDSPSKTITVALLAWRCFVSPSANGTPSIVHNESSLVHFGNSQQKNFRQGPRWSKGRLSGDKKKEAVLVRERLYFSFSWCYVK